MKLSPIELEESKQKLVNENILAEELIEALLYSYSKYAKINRDEAYKLRGEFNKRYIGKDENGKRKPYIKPELLAKMYEKSIEYKKAQPKLNQMREYYDNKEFLINTFLTPKLVHYIETKYKDENTGAPQLKYFNYYETTNCSYHLPVDTPADDLQLVKLPELLVAAEAPQPLTPIKYCGELMEHIKKYSHLIHLEEK